ncbi:hypothetical protein BKA65DRAFT_589489 [Rhexocercosporidium sp. MPI-PUGE-AT-0058]|nr:hypothetical protein BKA65DRAFT_589489 [Rhexocercosporidium sp. MPI-PUGE-AT-0058]
MTCRIVLLLSSIAVVSGLRWTEPQETISATITADWTPAPTTVPEKSAHELFRRYQYPANLCGAQGPNYVKAYCGDSSYCAWFTDIKVVGCCSKGGSCDAVYTTCIDRRDDLPQGESVPGVFTCSNLCYRNTFPDGYYQYGCASTSIGQSVVYSWPDGNPDVSIAILYTGDAFKDAAISPLTVSVDASSTEAEATPTISVKPLSTSKAVATSLVVSIKSPESPPTATRITPSLENPAGSSTIVSTDATASPKTSSMVSSSASGISDANGVQSKDQSKGLSMGAMIAIGVAVGVVAIVGIALLAFCCIRRRKQRKDPQHFLNTSADTDTYQVSQHDQPVMGTRTNPTELYQGLPVKSKEAQYHLVTARESPQYTREGGHKNSVAPSYELNPSCQPVRQASPLSTISSATFPSGSPRPSSMTPTPTMSQHPHMYELPTNRSATIP